MTMTTTPGTATLLNTCPACGAEESLDALLLRMVDDDQVRRLIAQVLTTSLPLGGLVVRYLRLHKPAKQKLRMDKLARLLAELVPDIQRNVIERNGRHWAVGLDGWKAALQAVFDAQAKGTLAVPLEGNGYLYGCLMRIADQGEAQGERQAERQTKGRAYQAGAATVGAVLDKVLAAQPQAPNAGVAATPPSVAPAAPPPRVDSPLVRQMKAELAAKVAAGKAAKTAVASAAAAATQPAPATPTDLPTPEKGVTHE